MRFTIVRLLLGVILINIVLTALFVLTVAGDFPLLARLLPGEVGFSAHAWGNYVFLALAVMINAIFVLSCGFAVIVPTIGDHDKDRVLEDTQVARWIFRIGALLFVLAFPVVCYTVAHAESAGAMFVDYEGTAVQNDDVALNDVLRFTADQVISGITFGAPEVFDRQLGNLYINPDEPFMPTVVLIFRIVVTLTFLTALVAAGRQSALKNEVHPPSNANKDAKKE